MAYTHGSNTGTHGVRTQGHSTMAMNSGSFTQALHAPGRSRPGYSASHSSGIDMSIPGVIQLMQNAQHRHGMTSPKKTKQMIE